MGKVRKEFRHTMKFAGNRERNSEMFQPKKDTKN